MNKNYILFGLFTLLLAGCSNKSNRVLSLTDELVVEAILQHSDDFSDGLANWKVEQGSDGDVFHHEGKLEITDKTGCTVWFDQKLAGPVMIEYEAYVFKEGGAYDRASDLNCFWMATDSENLDNLFANSDFREGKFSNYDSLSLYYVGMGGHDNTKTRFRRYTGNGEKPLLTEHDLTDSVYLITPNAKINIRLIAYENVVQYYRNDSLIFDYRDSQPYTDGYFGLRTVDNHMTIDNFKVYKLTEFED